MKRSFKFFSCAIACAALLTAALFTGCGTEEPPKGTVVLKAAPASLPETGGTVAFTVTNDGANVTSQAEIVNTTDGTTVENASWTTSAAGTWNFQATYNGVKSEPITVTAGKAPLRRTLLTKATYMDCPPCAVAQGNYEAMSDAQKNRFVVLAVHANQSGDKLYIPVGGALIDLLKPSNGYPEWYFNFETGSSLSGSTEINTQALVAQITRTDRLYPAVTGIKAISGLSGSTATVTATVKFDQAGSYRIGCALVEDVNRDDLGGKGLLPVYYNALRAAPTSLMGEDISPAATAGEEREFKYSVTLDPSWKSAGCSFVIYVFNRGTAAGGYIVNNAIECPVGGSIDYEYAAQ